MACCCGTEVRRNRNAQMPPQGAQSISEERTVSPHVPFEKTAGAHSLFQTARALLRGHADFLACHDSQEPYKMSLGPDISPLAGTVLLSPAVQCCCESAFGVREELYT